MAIDPKNYINIHGWMVTDLKLKGNDLLIYALIFGFSQDGNSKFKGGLKYLMDWCSASKNTVMKSLRELEESGLIIKNEIPVASNVKMCEYSISQEGRFKNCTAGSEIEPNNKYNNIYINIINYFNYILGSNFKPGVQKTKECVMARLNEGFTENDFKRVIDYKVSQWKNDEKMREYLRPQTLFGTKFESYLQASPNKEYEEDDEEIVWRD